MGYTLNILAISVHPPTLEALVSTLNQEHSWHCKGTTMAEEAIEKFHNQHPDLVLLDVALPKIEQQKMLKIFTLQNPHIKIIQHYGDGSGTLKGEIKKLFGDSNQEPIHIIDNAL